MSKKSTTTNGLTKNADIALPQVPAKQRGLSESHEISVSDPRDRKPEILS